MELLVPALTGGPDKREPGSGRAGGAELAPFLPPSLEVDVVTALQQPSTKAPFISALLQSCAAPSPPTAPPPSPQRAPAPACLVERFGKRWEGSSPGHRECRGRAERGLLPLCAGAEFSFPALPPMGSFGGLMNPLGCARWSWGRKDVPCASRAGEHSPTASAAGRNARAAGLLITLLSAAATIFLQGSDPSSGLPCYFLWP